MYFSQDKRRVNFTGVDLLHADQEEENDSCTTTDTLDEVSRLQNELHNARMEIHKLRRELMDTLTRPSGQVQWHLDKSELKNNCKNMSLHPLEIDE